MTAPEQEKPQAAEQKDTDVPSLPTSGEGSASIVLRLQVQRELANRPRQPKPPTDHEHG
jgi:hypothetical protein